MAARHFGVVRFDHDDPNLGGWASIDGGEAYRISSVGSLGNDTLWWTNLSFTAMYASNLNKVAHIKNTSYLNAWVREGQLDFCQGWGFLRRSHTEKAITEALSGIFARSMRFVGRAYGIDYSKTVPSHANLADELRCKMIPEKDAHLNADVDAALYAAHQYNTYCITPYHNPEDTVIVRFAAPAVAYAQEMLNSIVPTDQVEFVSHEQLPPLEQRIDWALAQQRPVLARVTVSEIHPDYVNVISLNGSKEGTRQWVTQPELLLLSQYATVEITAAFLFGSYTGLSDKCRLPEFSAMQAMTPTAEIVVTNHWLGLVKENPYKLEAKATTARAVSARAAWMTAIDRLMMFSYALQLHRSGLAVRRYGSGSVLVLVPRHNYRDAYEIAGSIGLMAPPNLVSDMEVQEDLHG